MADKQSGFQKEVTPGIRLLPLPDEVAIGALGWVTDPHGPVRTAVVAAEWNCVASAYRTRTALPIVDDLLAQPAPAASPAPPSSGWPCRTAPRHFAATC